MVVSNLKIASENRRAPRLRSAPLGSAHQRHFKVVFGHGVVQLDLLSDLLQAELRPQLSLLLHILMERNKQKKKKK